MKAVSGRIHRIEWSNPYTDPPNGAPRILAEVFTLGRTPPQEYLDLPVSLGGGYCRASAHASPPGRQLPAESLAGVRQKRLARRVRKKAPLFADELICQEMQAKPDYYAGETDAALKAAHDEVLTREAEAYADYLTRVDQVIIYASEPPECRVRAAQLLAEIQAGQWHSHS
jgi:hypothetical protein